MSDFIPSYDGIKTLYQSYEKAMENLSTLINYQTIVLHDLRKMESRVEDKKWKHVKNILNLADD